MAKSAFDDVKKIGKVLTVPLGKLNLSREQVVAVDIQVESITIAKLIYKKDWIVEKILHKSLVPPDGDYPLTENTGFYVSHLRTMLISQALMGMDGCIVLPHSASQVYFLDMELLDEQMFEEYIQDGTLNEQYPQLPKEIYNLNYSYNILKRDEDNGTMRMVLVVGEEKRLENYTTIVKRAGLNPTCIEPEVASILNTLSVQFGSSSFEVPSAFLVNTEVYSYIVIASKEGIVVENLNFLDSDRILLTHIEDIEDIEGDVWQEVFQRINEQIQSHIEKYNIKFQQSKVEELYFVSNRVKVKNFLAGLSQNSLDLSVVALDPIKSLTVKQSMAKYIAQFENKSTFAKVIGAGTSRLNAFKVKQKIKPFINFNLLPNKETLMKSRYITSCNKFFNYLNAFSFTAVICILGFLAFPTYLANVAELSDYKTLKSTYEKEKKENEKLTATYRYMKSIKETLEQDTIASNRKISNTLHKHILISVPTGVRIETLNYNSATTRKDKEGNFLISPSFVNISGITIDDLSFKEFIDRLKLDNNIQVTDFSLKEKEDGFKLFGLQLGLLKNFDKEIEG